jgi:hypothetical protein
MKYLTNKVLTFSDHHDNITTSMIINDMIISTLPREVTTMWYEFEFERERCRDRLATAARNRLVATCDTRLTYIRRVACSLGRALLHAGSWLLRYGRATEPATTRLHQPNTRSARLN